MAFSNPNPARSRSSSPENDVFSIATSIAPPQTLKVAGTTSISFDGLLEPALLLHEDLSEGCGGQLWPAGMTLAKYLLTYQRETLLHKTILEIGAGGGLVGLAVACGCPLSQKLFITDQVTMYSLMQKNVVLNKLEHKVQTEIYDWGTCPPPAFEKKQPDILLAADCVYFEPAFPLLLQTLTDLIGPETICYFCFKKRRKADVRFIKAMQKTFHCEQVEYGDREEDQRKGIHLYRVILKLR